MVEGELYSICLSCGTTGFDEVSSLCNNGHDNWLSEVDSIENFQLAMDVFGVSLSCISNAMLNRVELSIKE